MISAGQTKVTDIMVGRQILCKEKPKTKPTSKCAKKLTKTVKTAKKGLTAKQQKLWRQMVYTPAVLQAQRFCDVESRKIIPTITIVTGVTGKSHSTTQKYKKCVKKVLSGSLKFKGLFGKKFKWSDYLVNGAKIIKKLPPFDPFGTNKPM